jgi:tRNA-guanine family transglycosylase
MDFIPKHYFISDPSFREEPFVNWDYTSTILVTAYDLLRNEPLLYYLESNSMSLREYMIDNGFPSSTKILADSGIFALEWFKSMRSNTFKIDFSYIKLKPEEVFYAYQIIDPDFLCPLDEIILASDSETVVEEKINRMKENIVDALDNFSTKKIIGVLQGIKEEDIVEIFDFEKEQGIHNFARGGMIPLYFKPEYCGVIKFTREITKKYPLHAFGIVRLNQVSCYGKCLGMDSFDTTIVRPLTAKLYYLTPELKKERFNDEVFLNCECHHCKLMKEYDYELMERPATKLMINLYLHNIMTLETYASKAIPFLKR